MIVGLLVVLQERVVIVERGAAFGSPNSAKNRFAISSSDSRMRSSSADPNFFSLADSGDVAAQILDLYLLTETPKYWPTTSSISCASSKTTA